MGALKSLAKVLRSNYKVPHNYESKIETEPTPCAR